MGLNDQPACVWLHINERANQPSKEIAENHAVNKCIRLQINTPGITKQNTLNCDRLLKPAADLVNSPEISLNGFVGVSVFDDLSIQQLLLRYTARTFRAIRNRARPRCKTC